MLRVPSISLPLDQDIFERLSRAIEVLIEQDSYLFKADLHERSITHKFAEHLQREFPEWSVDCEYNRDGHEPKRLLLPSISPDPADDGCERSVFPDIIIHHRGQGVGRNLLVIEAKKSTSGSDDGWDELKLRKFKEQLGYRYALFVRFRTREEEPGVEVLDCS